MPGPARGGDGQGAVRQASLRTTNLAAALRAVLGSVDPVSRAGVAGALGVTRSTASRLVDELVDSGVLVELDPGAASGRGRPGVPLRASPRVAALGLQVNTTFLAARVVNLRGEVLGEHRETADLRGSQAPEVLLRLDRLAGLLLDDLAGSIDLVGAGLALPGIVEADSGRLLVAPNLGWSDVRPADHLPGLADLTRAQPLLLGNEADLAASATAEVAPGRAGPLQDFLYLSGENGIGAAAVLGGQLLTGRHGWAGELGHACADPHGPVCRCGSTGCLELYAGRQAILAAAGLPPGTSPRELADLARAGHVGATRAVDAAATALAVVLGGAVNLLDLNVVVLGGHLAQLSDVLAPRLEQQLARRVLSARWVPPRVEVHGTDDALGASGAAFVPLRRVVDDPGTWIGHRTAG